MNLRLLVIFFVVLSTCFLVFSATISYEFVNWDDDIYVYDNEKIRSMAVDDMAWWFGNVYYYSYSPLTMLSHSLDYLIWGLTPRGHHLTNVLLHCVNTGWVFLFGLVFASRSRPQDESFHSDWRTVMAMAMAALLFAVHPLRAESVAWISDRKDLLCVFFLIPSAMFYLLATDQADPRHSRFFLILTFLLYVCAILSKSVAIGFPLVLLALDWFLRPVSEWKEQWKSLLTAKLWFFVVSFAMAAVLLMIPTGGKRAYAVEQLSGIDVFLFPLYSLTFPLSKTILPLDLSPIYPSVETIELAIGALVFVVITLATILLARKGRREYFLCWFAYVVFLLPTVAGLSSGMQAQADRFSYLPTIGIFLCIGGGLVSLFNRGSALGRTLAPLTILVLITGFALLTIKQSTHWESSEDLWRYVVKNAPPAPDYVDAYVNLGAVYAAKMDLPRAERILGMAVGLDSTSADAFYNLGHVLYLRGEWEQAAAYFRRTVLIDSTYARGYFNYAIVTSQLGADSLAIPAMRRAARLGLKEAVDALRQSGIPLEEGGGTIPTE